MFLLPCGLIDAHRRLLAARSAREEHARHLRLPSVLGLSLAVAAAAATPLMAQNSWCEANGFAPGDWFGYSVAGIGDVNKDGWADVVVGAWLDARGGTEAGSATVLSGKDCSELQLLLGSAYDTMGSSAAGVGDVNADGWPDFAVGAEQEHGGARGYVKLFSGKDWTILHTFTGDSSGDQFGFAVAGAGDVDGNGSLDIVIGANQDDQGAGGHSGSAWVYSGASPYTLIRRLDGVAGNDEFGNSVAGLGDVDADGYDDVLVGAPGASSNIGACYAFSGRTWAMLWTRTGNNLGDDFGNAASSVPDLDGDGISDAVVGALLADTNNVQDTGAVYALSGATGVLIWAAPGLAAGDRMGTSVGAAGDLDGDGFPELLGGAPGADNATSPGYVQLLSGTTGSVVSQVQGDSSGDRFGCAVAGIGDLDGDTLDDFVVGATHDDNNGSNSGMARLFITGVAPCLVLTPPVPGIAGQVNTMWISEATPGSIVVLLYGFRLDQWPAPGCPGVMVDIYRPRLGGIFYVTDPGGTLLVTRFVPSNAQGRTVYIQAVEQGTCCVSNLVTITFQ